MKKLNKITNIALIFTVIVSNGALYAHPNALRVPLDQKKLHERMEVINSNGNHSMSIEEWEAASPEQRILFFMRMPELIMSGVIRGKYLPDIESLEDREDVISAGVEKLAEIAHGVGNDVFDPGLGYRPSTFLLAKTWSAMWAEYDRMFKHRYNMPRTTARKYHEEGKRSLVSVSHIEDLEKNEKEAALISKEIIKEDEEIILANILARIENFIKPLTQKQQVVFILNTYGEVKQPEMSKMLYLTGPRISQIRTKIKAKIRGNESAEGILREIKEISGGINFNEDIVEYFRPMIKKEQEKGKKAKAKRRKPVRKAHRKTRHFPLIEIKEGEIPVILEVFGLNRNPDLKNLLKKYMEIVHDLKAIGIDEGFNTTLNFTSALIIEGRKNRNKQKLINTAKIYSMSGFSANTHTTVLEKLKDKDIENPFLEKLATVKGLPLEEIKKNDIPKLLDRFPADYERVDPKEIEETLKRYIAHVRLMKKLRIKRGRTRNEDMISAFIKLSRERKRKISRREISRESLVFSNHASETITKMRSYLKSDSGWIDIFAASKKEDEALKMAFLKELSSVKGVAESVTYLKAAERALKTGN